MKANELRTGNYVRFAESGSIFQVDSVSSTGLDVHDEIESVWIELDQFEPIPITEEWLIRFGFERKGYTSCLGKLCLHHKEPMYPNGRVYYNSWAILDKIPDYIHTLQNLYFALTGEELTIKD